MTSGLTILWATLAIIFLLIFFRLIRHILAELLSDLADHFIEHHGNMIVVVLGTCAWIIVIGLLASLVYLIVLTMTYL